MVDQGQKILAELGVEVGKVSSMEESVVVVVSSFFLEKYSAKKKKKQSKTKQRDLISQVDGSQIARGRCVHLSTGHRFTGRYHIAI